MLVFKNNSKITGGQLLSDILSLVDLLVRCLRVMSEDDCLPLQIQSLRGLGFDCAWGCVSACVLPDRNLSGAHCGHCILEPG